MSQPTDSVPVSTGTPPHPPRLLDQLRLAAEQHGHLPTTVERYAAWCRRYILFHHKRHPRDLGASEIDTFLQHVAQTEADPVNRLEDAKAALLYLYRAVLHYDPGDVPLPPAPRLLDRVRQAIRVRHYSPRTEDCYVQWITRYIHFHGRRHPRELGATEVEQFLTDLVVRDHVAAMRDLNAVLC
jgi:hypothetical protein